jgi:CHAT domain-containing protein
LGERLLSQQRHFRCAITDIARNLPEQTALLDFIQYREYDFAVATNRWGEQHYAVYLTFPLAKDATNIVVERVDLGEAAPINDAIGNVCKQMSAGHFAGKNLPAAMKRLSGLIYGPIGSHLANASHLLVCPDGQLSRLPFEMLPIGDRFLVEEKTISYITSGREVVRLVQPTIAQRKPQNQESLVMGNPDFDMDLAKAGSTGLDLVSTSNTLSHNSDNAKRNSSQLTIKKAASPSSNRDYHGLRFEPLPGAEAEARSVAKLLGTNCILLLGPEAREAALEAMTSPHVLHIATHGFFLSEQDSKNMDGLRNKPASSENEDSAIHESLTQLGQDWQNPMVCCGIALAGANNAQKITNAVAEDGLLTGLKASLLDLHGTELVILSACDSGTGEVKIGEGMMSLRRAFRIAGAQTVLASHWNISDKATSQLMTEFIRRWQTGEPRVRAWREAQLSLLHSKDFSNPYFWAAFTLTGEWR